MLALLAFMDFFSAVVLILLSLGVTIKVLLALAAIYLFVKGMIFVKDVASIIDIIIAVALFSSIFITLPKIAIIIFAIFLVQKSIFSAFS
jgi:hypothetical protein